MCCSSRSSKLASIFRAASKSRPSFSNSGTICCWRATCRSPSATWRSASSRCRRDRYIALYKRHIAAQRERILRLEQRGEDTAPARDLLDTFEHALQVAAAHRDTILSRVRMNARRAAPALTPARARSSTAPLHGGSDAA
jgi:hypothetical protein